MFKLLLFLICSIIAKQVHPKQAHPKQTHTIEHPTALIVDDYHRDNIDIENFTKFLALIMNVPENVRKDFCQKQKEQMRVRYMEELRKTALVRKHAPEIFKDAETKSLIEAELHKIRDALLQNDIPTYIAKEYITGQIVYSKFMQKMHNLGASTNRELSKHILHLQTTNLKRRIANVDDDTIDGYAVTEIALDKKYLKDEAAQREIINTVKMVLNQVSPDITAIAFSKSISATVGGQLGLIHHSAMPENIKQQYKKTRSNIIITKEPRGLIMYIIAPKNKKDLEQICISEKQVENGVYMQNLMRLTYTALENMDGNQIGVIG